MNFKVLRVLLKWRIRLTSTTVELLTRSERGHVRWWNVILHLIMWIIDIVFSLRKLTSSRLHFNELLKVLVLKSIVTNLVRIIVLQAIHVLRQLQLERIILGFSLWFNRWPHIRVVPRKRIGIYHLHKPSINIMRVLNRIVHLLLKEIFWVVLEWVLLKWSLFFCHLLEIKRLNGVLI